MRITVCQLDNRPGHRDDALAALADHVAGAGSELVVLPELPFSDWLAADAAVDPARWQSSVEEHDAAVERLGRLGAAAVIASRPIVGSTGSRRNQAFVWTPAAGATGIREKHYLPDEPGFWEATWYDPGDLSFDLCHAGEARAGVQLCTELWFLEWARHYGREGAEVLCLPRATPYESLDKWLAGGRTAAVCSGAYSVSSNQWSPGGSGLDCGGLGWVIDPDGTVLATTGPDEPFVTVDADLTVARTAKTTYPRYVREQPERGSAEEPFRP
ncbi:carbon-nitrogen hydrolase family protein [Pseudosporangium ferrugineum]|uniref:N-carbamoylputrescine amidase n=1 Tax=Pseudosporangium ferrugineum TaxID=439699 RepID=A0A2T0RHC3_9ACTN|nr:carbon-nitrogen hydrolase family protein [Pseudosporangium ferrugineum]PRY20568.1 N-carbamoylputrescine amidase [Pseudosporangium ferrugineum]